MKYQISEDLNERLRSGIKKLPINNEFELSVAVIDNRTERFFDYQGDMFIYPASIYKLFIVAEAVRLVMEGKMSLYDKISISTPNDIDKIKAEVGNDPRPLLRAGESVTLEYLIDLVLTRSDNTAANVLIDIVDRNSINKNIIEKHGWHGSEVTRKYLPRSLEVGDSNKNAPVTYSCAHHLVDFCYKLQKGDLFENWLGADIMLHYMQKSYINRHKGPSFEDGIIFQRKGGWTSSKLNNGRFMKYEGYAGIVKGVGFNYSVAVLTWLKSENFSAVFPIQELSELIHEIAQT